MKLPEHLQRRNRRHIITNSIWQKRYFQNDTYTTESSALFRHSDRSAGQIYLPAAGTLCLGRSWRYRCLRGRRVRFDGCRGGNRPASRELVAPDQKYIRSHQCSVRRARKSCSVCIGRCLRKGLSAPLQISRLYWPSPQSPEGRPAEHLDLAPRFFEPERSELKNRDLSVSGLEIDPRSTGRAWL